MTIKVLMQKALRGAFLGNKYKSRGKYLGSILVALGGTAVQARIVSYGFSANITDISEYAAGYESSQSVDQSTFLDFLISHGDALTGSFSYDVDAPLATAFQPPPPSTGSELIYQSDAANQGINFSGTSGIYYMSGSAPVIIVFNQDSSFNNADALYISDSASANADANFSQTSSLFLLDATGSTLGGPGIPTRIDLENYASHDLTTTWVRASDGNQLTVTASLSSLSYAVADAPIAAVPEPASRALMWAGLGVLGVLARRRMRSGVERAM